MSFRTFSDEDDDAERLGLLGDDSPLASPDATRPAVNLTFKDLQYEVKDRHILKGVSGYVKAGEMMAILGPSGAGKTTMLDILAQRQKGGTITGEVNINGEPVHINVFRRISAYVQQEDIMHGYLTVRETVTYAARLRLPDHVTRRQIDERVASILKELNIYHVADRKIGSEVVRGVSGGEKKRTAIGVELVTQPSLIFLDEPTTGLDTFTALHLMYILRKLCTHGCTVVFSVHQPRSNIFKLFDSVLLLTGNGEQGYFGSARLALNYFESIGVHLGEPDNPADFLLDSVSVMRDAEDMDRDEFPFLPPDGQADRIAVAFKGSEQAASVVNMIGTLENISRVENSLPPPSSTPYPRRFISQVAVVSSRAFVNKIRDPIATFVGIITAIIFATLVGSIYYHVGHDKNSVQARMGVLFFLTMNVAFSSLGSLALFMFDRSIYTREHANGMYRPSAYYIGKIIQDVPLAIIITFLFDAIAYYMIGLQPAAGKFMYFVLLNNLVMLNSYGMCLFFSMVSPNIQVANVVAPLVIVLYLLPSGFLIPLDSIPPVWRWIKYISFFRFGFEAMVLNEFIGLEINYGNYTQPGEFIVQDQFGFDPDQFSYCTAFVGGSAAVYIFLGYVFLVLLRGKEAK